MRKIIRCANEECSHKTVLDTETSVMSSKDRNKGFLPFMTFSKQDDGSYLCEGCFIRQQEEMLYEK